jgi:hypothetical protein
VTTESSWNVTLFAVCLLFVRRDPSLCCPSHRALSRSCTRLRDLNLKGMPSVTAKGLRDIALACKALKRLNLAHCAAVDDAAITTIAANLWGLEELDLSGA